MCNLSDYWVLLLNETLNCIANAVLMRFSLVYFLGDSNTGRNLSENLPESVVSPGCVRRSGRAHRGKSALELLGIASRKTSKPSSDAKQITGKTSAVVRDQRFVDAERDDKGERSVERSVEKQKSCSESFQSERSLQGDQRSSENDRCLELLEDCRTEKIKSEEQSVLEKAQPDESHHVRCSGNDLRSTYDLGNDQGHREKSLESLTERIFPANGDLPLRVIDRSETSPVVASSKASSTLAQSFKGTLSMASRQVITVSRRLEDGSNKEVANRSGGQATKVSRHNSADYEKDELTGTSLEHEVGFERDDVEESSRVVEVSRKETISVHFCTSTEIFPGVCGQELAGSLLDVSETDREKLLLESGTVECSLQRGHEIQQQNKELEVVTHDNGMVGTTALTSSVFLLFQ